MEACQLAQEQPERLWVVVKVESGIPAIVEAYRGRLSAKAREQRFRWRMNPDNDETGVFGVLVGQADDCV
jgi:hypothetical protein